jgi:acyl dehydratase
LAQQGPQQPYFEDIDPGDEFEESWTAQTEQVVAYVDMNMNGGGAAGGRFTSQEGAEAVGMPRPIVPGVMSMCILTRVVTDWMGPQGVLRFIDVDFRRPVQHGDQLRALALITDTEEESGGAGVVKLDVYLENERGERPLQGVAIVELPRKVAA